MPKTLLGWVYFVALLAACLVPQMAKAGSAQPITEEQASELIMAASSQRITREQECGKKLADERLIHDYHDAGWTARKLIGQAANAPDVADDNWDALLALILAAHKYEGGPKAWFANAWTACMDGA